MCRCILKVCQCVYTAKCNNGLPFVVDVFPTSLFLFSYFHCFHLGFGKSIHSQLLNS